MPHPPSWLARLASLAFAVPAYRESELSRLANLFAHVDLERWRGLRVLEVGAGPGRLGDAFADLGFDVTSTDGRPAHVERLVARGRRAFVLDLDAGGVEGVGSFGVVLAFGVLYHLGEPERFLASCGRLAPVLLLESAVTDAAEPVLPRVVEPGGWRGQDQALHRRGCRPSPAWVEATCRAAGYTRVRDVSTALANWRTGVFDWTPRGDGRTREGRANLRKMWVAERDAAAPGR